MDLTKFLVYFVFYQLKIIVNKYVYLRFPVECVLKWYLDIFFCFQVCLCVHVSIGGSVTVVPVRPQDPSVQTINAKDYHHESTRLKAWRFLMFPRNSKPAIVSSSLNSILKNVLYYRLTYPIDVSHAHHCSLHRHMITVNVTLATRIHHRPRTRTYSFSK